MENWLSKKQTKALRSCDGLHLGKLVRLQFWSAAAYWETSTGSSLPGFHSATTTSDPPGHFRNPSKPHSKTLITDTWNILRCTWNWCQMKKMWELLIHSRKTIWLLNLENVHSWRTWCGCSRLLFLQASFAYFPYFQTRSVSHSSCVPNLHNGNQVIIVLNGSHVSVQESQKAASNTLRILNWNRLIYIYIYIYINK